MPLLTANERVGTILKGKYRLDRILGEGGMGVVFAATNLATGRAVAVKLLHPENLRAGVTVARFLDEARAASAVRHPNVVDVLDLDSAHDGAPFIVMELLHGETLRAMLDRRRTLAPADAWRVLRQAMRAIAAAHAAGVVHRDLKPENIFLHDDGDGGAVTKVVDFGIARIGNARRTATGTQIGTPVYMSPEQARGADIGPWSDVWAMGAIWFEALTGRLPFDFPREATDAAVLAHVISTPPASIAGTRDVSPALGNVIDRSLRRERKERFPEMASFEVALASAFGESSSLAPSPPAAQMGRAVLPRTVPLAPSDVPRPAVAPRPAPAPRRSSVLTTAIGVGAVVVIVIVVVLLVGGVSCIGCLAALGNVPVRDRSRMAAECNREEDRCTFTNDGEGPGSMCVVVALRNRLNGRTIESDQVCATALAAHRTSETPLRFSQSESATCHPSPLLGDLCAMRVVQIVTTPMTVSFANGCDARPWPDDDVRATRHLDAHDRYTVTGRTADGGDRAGTAATRVWYRVRGHDPRTDTPVVLWAGCAPE